MKQFRNMLYPYVVWLFIMVLVPMLMILLYAFTTAGNEVTTFRFTLENFSRFLTDCSCDNGGLRAFRLPHRLYDCQGT